MVDIDVADIDELFGDHRPYVTTPDGISHIGQVGQTEWGADKKWHAKVTHWDGHVVYDGPAPVPPGIADISIDELNEGKAYHFEMTPVD